MIPAPFGVYIKNDNSSFVEPDISVICDEEKQSDGIPLYAILSLHR